MNLRWAVTAVNLWCLSLVSSAGAANLAEIWHATSWGESGWDLVGHFGGEATSPPARAV